MLSHERHDGDAHIGGERGPSLIIFLLYVTEDKMTRNIFTTLYNS